MKKLKEKLDRWSEANPKATLREISEAVEVELERLRKELTEGLLEKEKKGLEGYECPNCQKGMVRNGQRKRQIVDKGGQTIEYEREQWRCKGCGYSFFPSG